MRTSTLFGAIIGSVLVAAIFAISPEDLVGLFNPVALLITLGGTLAAGIVSFSWRAVGPTLEALALVVWRGRRTLPNLADDFVGYARKVRDSGVTSLAEDAAQTRDPLLRLGLQMVADGAEVEHTIEVLRLEARALARRRQLAERVFRVMGGYAPMFGLIGTIIGLIRMLRHLSDPSQIGKGMAVALVTTLYGVLAAAIVFLPFASKVRELATEEAQRSELMHTGLRGVQAGENPQALREKLETFTRRGDTG